MNIKKIYLNDIFMDLVKFCSLYIYIYIYVYISRYPLKTKENISASYPPIFIFIIYVSRYPRQMRENISAKYPPIFYIYIYMYQGIPGR